MEAELVFEAKAFLKRCGLKHVTFYGSQQQLAGYANDGDTSYELILDFKEKKATLSAIRGSDVVSYESVSWQDAEQAHECVAALIRKHGVPVNFDEGFNG